MLDVTCESLRIVKAVAACVHELDISWRVTDRQRRGHAVARYTRHILNDADHLPRQRIEQRTLAHIGPADDGDDWKRRHELREAIVAGCKGYRTFAAASSTTGRNLQPSMVREGETTRLNSQCCFSF